MQKKKERKKKKEERMSLMLNNLIFKLFVELMLGIKQKKQKQKKQKKKKKKQQKKKGLLFVNKVTNSNIITLKLQKLQERFVFVYFFVFALFSFVFSLIDS